MKNLTRLAVVALITGYACAQVSLPEWNVTLRVMDESGNPVPDATAKVWYFIPPPPDDIGGIAMTNIAGLTDGSGVFRASQHSGSIEVTCEAVKNGYYGCGRTHEFAKFKDSDPAKWNPTVILVLKKIGHPIPMYVRQAQIEIPVAKKPVGFDFVEHDWVAPYGKGKKGDIIFESNRRWASPQDFNSTLKVTFTNLGDGLIAASTFGQGSSGPKLPAIAPSTDYTPELRREFSHTPASGWKDDGIDQNYYLRVRTVLDESGNVKSALYGKIYGGFGLDPINSNTTLIFFTYYLNPSLNDRNTEFDPKQNLFKPKKSRDANTFAP